jgi:pimeloyl-ACP methyl ester carboxylesterase
MSRPSLHVSTLRARDQTPSQSLLVLHGILGSGQNLRSLAQRLIQADPTLEAVLVDLRLHGRSQGFEPPHTVAACAEDLQRLEQTLAWPVSQVLGHSFGGKVALAYHALRPDLTRVMLLDSSPGPRSAEAPEQPVRGSEQTFAILGLLAALPERFAQREDFLREVVARGQSRSIAEWLAMNLARVDDGYELRLDLRGIRALLADYFARDLWDVVADSRARLDVVIGGRSDVWSEADKQRFAALAARPGADLHTHVLEQAGHWLHIDDPEGLRAALLGARPRSSDTP